MTCFGRVWENVLVDVTLKIVTCGVTVRRVFDTSGVGRSPAPVFLEAKILGSECFFFFKKKSDLLEVPRKQVDSTIPIVIGSQYVLEKWSIALLF